MKPVALKGDTIFCPNTPQCRYPKLGKHCPKGTIVIVSPSRTFISGRPPATLSDKAICCSGTFLVSASSTVFVEGKPVHRLGDRNFCGGFTVGPGDPKCLIG